MFKRSGHFSVVVTAFNGISQMTTSFTVHVQHPISAVSMTIAPVAHGYPSEIVAAITVGGSNIIQKDDYRLNITLGDSNSMTLEPDLCVVDNSTTDHRLECELSHQYIHQGTYHVTLNVSNAVSWHEAQSTARVETAVDGVRVILVDEDDNDVMVTGPVGVAVGSTIRTRVSLDRGGGDHLSFHWDFGDDDDDGTIPTG